jgi:TRAP-type C4-dicarboxylate transport system permease small subunit
MSRNFKAKINGIISLGTGNVLTRISGLFTALLTFAMFIAVFVSVIFRYVFGHPIGGIDEVVAFVFSVCVFVGLAYTFSIGGHISVDIVFRKTSKKVQTWLQLLGHIIGLLISVIMIYYGFLQVVDSYQTGIRTMSVLQIPVYYAQIGIPLGFFILFLEIVREMILLIKK